MGAGTVQERPINSEVMTNLGRKRSLQFKWGDWHIWVSNEEYSFWVFKSIYNYKVSKYLHNAFSTLNVCASNLEGKHQTTEEKLKCNQASTRYCWSGQKEHDNQRKPICFLSQNCRRLIERLLLSFPAKFAGQLIPRLPQDLDLGLDGGHDGLLIFLTVYAALCLLFWKMRILDYFECKKSAKEAILIERMIIVHIDASLWTRRWIQWFLVILNQH